MPGDYIKGNKQVKPDNCLVFFLIVIRLVLSSLITKCLTV